MSRRRAPFDYAFPAAAGFRRVDWVRVTMDHDSPRCDVVGVGHRLPVVRRVPLRIAAAFVAAGVPVVVRTSGRARRRQGMREQP